MTFDDIIGHERQLAILRRAVAGGSIAHAYLFSGESGIGKKTVAVALGAAVNCSSTSNGTGCGRCGSCGKASSGNHPDIHILSADGGEIKIDQVREAQAILALKPFEGKMKVLIVDDADSLNSAAQNAFLKTLEEPPGDSLIILVAVASESLLPTIRSRCQKIAFYPLPRRLLAKMLIEKQGMAEDEAMFIAAVARGSIGRGLGMDPEAERLERAEALELLAKAYRGMDTEDLLSSAEAVSKSREKLERFLEIGLEWLRDVMVFGETGDDGIIIHRHMAEMLGQWAGTLPRQRLLSDMKLFEQSRSLLDRRVGGQLVAENLLMKLSGM